MSRAASLHESDDDTTPRRRRAARLLPLILALLFIPAASQQQNNQRRKQTEQTKQSGGVTTQQQPPPPPTCPNITVRCSPKIDAGRPAAFTAYLKRTGPKARREAFRWTISAGNDRMLKEQSADDVHRIAVNTDGLGGKRVRATFAVAGYGPGCESSCDTIVAPTAKPTPTQRATPTQNETPTQKETPTFSPTPVTTETPPPTPALPTNDNSGPTGTFTPAPPGASLSPSPSPNATPPVAVVTTSPSASPSSVVNAETTDAGFVQRYWPVLLLLGLLTAGLALLAAKLYGARLRRPLSPTALEPVLPAPSIDTGKEHEKWGVLVGGTTRETDELQCSVYAPHEGQPGEGFLVQAFAHLREHAPQLEALAKEADREAARRGADRLGAVARGQELLFHLDMPGLTVDEPTQPVVWSGEIESVQFGVNIPADFRPRRINCKLTVSVREFPIGHVRFVFEVAAAPRPAGGDVEETRLGPGGEFVRYRKGFVSYASQDLPEVLARVQVMRLLGIEVFHDLLSLKPGERWERALYKHIDDSDVFFLFWSAAAYKSEWVEKEVRYALARKGADDERPPEILPVILEGPPETPPPSYLNERHFNDPIALLIKAAAARRQPKKDA